MTAMQAFVEILGSNEYLRLRCIIAKTSIGEGDTPARCREAISDLVQKIKGAIKKAKQELPDYERREFKILLQREVDRLKDELRSMSA